MRKARPVQRWCPRSSATSRSRIAGGRFPSCGNCWPGTRTPSAWCIGTSRRGKATPHAELAAEAAEAAAVQGKFWEFHDLLFLRTGELDGELLAGIARRLGLDLARFHPELETHVHRARVLQDVEAARARGLRGTPGFYLDGKLVDTSFGLHHLRDAVHAGLAAGPRTGSLGAAVAGCRTIRDL